MTLLVKLFYQLSVDHSVDKNIMSPYDLSFLNLTIILFVIPSVYIEEIFPLAYLWTYFIVGLISSIILSVKVICHYTIWLFFFIPYFIVAISSVHTERIVLSVFTDGNKDGKFCRLRSSQYTNKKISSVFLFIFTSFFGNEKERSIFLC
jgi:hypothetical protein